MADEDVVITSLRQVAKRVKGHADALGEHVTIDLIVGCVTRIRERADELEKANVRNFELENEARDGREWKARYEALLDMVGDVGREVMSHAELCRRAAAIYRGEERVEV